jgi:ABC-type proline/glycine betaine transport system ATPase subunit
MPEDIIPSTFNRSYSITADFDPSDGDTTEGVSRRPHRGRRGPARGDRSRDQRVLVLDEAVAALDVSIQAQILNLLADVREATGISYVFITHDLAVVRQVSYSIVVQSGRIVERGRTDALRRDPQHLYTRALLDSVPRPGWKPQRRALPAVDTQ